MHDSGMNKTVVGSKISIFCDLKTFYITLLVVL